MTTNQHQEVPPMTPDTEQLPTSTPAVAAGTTAPAGVRAPGSRPSPRPRPAPPAAPEPVLDDVTVSNSALSSGDLQNSPAERDTAWKVSTLHRGLHWDLTTVRDWIEKAGARSRAYWIPPRFLTQPPASIAQMTAYARRAGWTQRTTGLLRGLGVGWFYAVALPVVVSTRWFGWVCERPGRGLLALVVWQLLIRTGGGPWIAVHLIEPLLGALAWLLLP